MIRTRDIGRLIVRILGLILALVAVAFAISNRHPVSLTLWPLPGSVAVPAYLAILVPLAVGLVAGAMILWTAGLGARLRARREKARADSLARQIDAAKNTATAAQGTATDADHSASPPPPSP